MFGTILLFDFLNPARYIYKKQHYGIMTMLFRETGKEGNESVRFIRTFYCSEAKGARQKTLGKIKRADVASQTAIDVLLAELGKNDATSEEVEEVTEWLTVMQNKRAEDLIHAEKRHVLYCLRSASEAPDKALDALSEADQAALFDSIKRLEDRLREKGIRRPRKPRSK